MLKYKLLAIISICGIFHAIAQLKSPAEFLGYKIGDQFTPHHKVESYFKYLAAQCPKQIYLEQYGATTEGRPLFIAVVSSVENMANLEKIRLANLSVAASGAVNDSKVLAERPSLVWLSYNVHGNEASSTEAALLTIYNLVRPSSPSSAWLQNAIVVIDPCLNPDGRDRYVNWYQSVVGVRSNPLPLAREHKEPWPGGRSNHYYFDLNRDWAWLTQVETQQRIKVYRKWLPQIHVDFHEQGYNEPYYFAPAAEPLHEVITPWQREFQNSIGKNHAGYFDKEGWLYFTKERFDLLYPSYGDTYPMYNGSIGMTYEQGGIGAGLRVINEDGDTLQLADRITHHFTTSFSTIEMASKERARLIKEFEQYFSLAQKEGIGKYKSFVIKYEEKNKDRINKLLKLLEAHDIKYGFSSRSFSRGINYFTGQEETFSITKNDIVVSALQPGSALLQVLMEPQTILKDSITYDITAWSLPYAFGLQSYACKEMIQISPMQSEIQSLQFPDATYGYALPWSGITAASFAGKLLQQGVFLRYAEEDFYINGQRFGAGTVLILPTSNEKWGKEFLQTIKLLALKEDITIVPLNTGMVDKGADFGSDRVKPFSAVRVALLTGEGTSSLGVGEVWHFMDKELKYPVTLLSTNNFSHRDLQNFDVLILADGRYKFLESKDAFEGVKEWVAEGGKLIAFESVLSQLSKLEIGVKSKSAVDSTKLKIVENINDLPVFSQRERAGISKTTSGSIWKVRLDTSHPLAFGYAPDYYTLKADASIYEYLDDRGWNVGVLGEEKPVAGFVGDKIKSSIKNGWVIGQLKIGKGTINMFADDFLFRCFWENGKLFLPNAIFFKGE